jgi:hypothetical protein
VREVRPSFLLAEEMVARLGARAILFQAVRAGDVDLGAQCEFFSQSPADLENKSEPGRATTASRP